MKYQTVVFDMDGTLVNTIPDIVFVVNSVLRKNGIAEKSMNEVKNGVGFGVEHLLRTLEVPEHLISGAVIEIDKEYSCMKTSKSFVYNGIRKLIEKVSSAEVHIFILSNKLQGSLERSVSDHLSFANFLHVQGSQPGNPAKPSPDMLLKMLHKFEEPIDSVLMMGDGEADVAVAKAAGIRCLSVLWGFRSRKVLEASGADLFAATPKDAAEFILMPEQ
jgi:phosphoglycolate phosphatase